MSQVVVIGAGLAGLTAAIQLAAAGVRTTVLTKGVGGLPLSQGTIDVLGYTGTNGSSTRVTEPLTALAGLAADRPDHPYAVIGADAVRAGLAFVQDVVGPDLLAGTADTNQLFPTAVGAVRPTCLAHPSMLAGACVDGAKFAIVGLRRLKDFHPGLVAGNLARTVLDGGGRMQARALFVDVPARPGEADSGGLSYARAFDSAAYRASFADELRPLLAEGETVGLPAVLGLRDATAWRDLADKLEHPVFEIPLPPPSVPGMRLNTALTAAARSAGVRVVNGSWATDPRIESGRIRSVRVTTAGAPREIAADAFLLAGGGFESGALSLDSHDTVTERVFGLPLAGVTGELVHGDYWGAQQPLFAVGVAVDSAMRVIEPGGGPVYENLWAAGGVLAGAQRWSEKSGEGIALGSAVKAAEAIAKELV